jgi:hypothetical protein
MTKKWNNNGAMELLASLRTAEIHMGDFLVPWGLIVGALGFLAAWALIVVMERRGWTRHVWHLPLFFVSLVVLFGCILGILLAP